MARVVVVGGGTSGCIVAARLSGDPARDVTLLEAGDADGPRSPDASSLTDVALPAAVWPDVYTRGRGLGGSSRINGAVLSGPVPDGLPVETPRDEELGPIDRALLSIAGAERVRLLRDGGRLLSTADLELAGARARPNLHIVPRAYVDHLCFAGRRAIGVVLGDGTVVGADHVVLCAGAIGSASLLLRSGVIGPGLGEIVDHAAHVIDLDLTVDADPAGLVTGSVLRRRGVELVALNHVGAAIPRRGALIAGWLGSTRTGRVVADGTISFDPLDDRTVAGVERSVALAVEVLASRPFREIVGDYRVAAETGGYFHAAGSCRGLVDHRGRVAGYDGITVVDASAIVLPPHGPFTAVIEAARGVVVG